MAGKARQENGVSLASKMAGNGPKSRREPMVDIATAAAYFSVAEVTLRRFISTGKVKSYRLGRKLLRVRIGEVEADLTKMRKPGRPRKVKAI